ncbi:MAG: sigma-54-dependent Fis family transcriptional regulator [Rhizobacter sp.]
MSYQSFSSESPSQVLSLDGEVSHPLSIRAKSLVFVDPASKGLLELIERVAPSTAPIMIEGDSGTGKELIARHVHRLSGRTGPFVAVNCGAISEQLAESELFGHEVGAFTGATSRREGWFEAANHGTLFLDEIGDLPLPMQVKLLRVIQEQEVVRLGSRKPIPVDVRLVTATNVDLGEAVSAGHFRLDLYYRLNIAQLRLPPLRERVGDILPLAKHFLSVYSRKLKFPLPVLGAAAVRALEAYAWPGNIRELENVIHYALLVASGQEIRPEHLKLNGVVVAPGHTGEPNKADASGLNAVRSVLRNLFDDPGATLFNDLEQLIVEEAFRESGYNQVRSAALLGISRNVLRTLLKRHGMLNDALASPDESLQLAVNG